MVAATLDKKALQPVYRTFDKQAMLDICRTFDKQALLDICRSAARNGRKLTKISTIGGDPESSFEQAFASLGFSYIKDKAPRLLDYMSGFQLVDRNEDNTKAVGIYGFQLGNQWVYAPIFFLNGDIKGHELLYLKGQDLFLPLKENWINYLLAKKPHILGGPEQETTRQLGVLQPDIRGLSMMPSYAKFGSHRPVWYQAFLPSLGKILTQSPRTLKKFAGLDDRLSVPKLCGTSLMFARMAKTACDEYPEIKRLCDEFYGRGWLKSALEELKDKATKTVAETGKGTSILKDTLENVNHDERDEIREEVTNHDGKNASFLLSGRSRRRKTAAGDPVDIRVYEDLGTTHNDTELSEDDRTKLYRDGYLIRDYRSGEEVSKAYSVQQKVELSNPDASGLHDLLLKPGKFEEALIVNEPYTARGRCDFATVVRMSGTKNWTNIHSSKLWTKPQIRSAAEQKKWFEGLDDSSPNGLETDNTYIVLSPGPSGTIDGSVPFIVRDNLGEGRYRVEWMDYSDNGRPVYLRNVTRPDAHNNPVYYSTEGNWGLDRDMHGNADLLFLSDREGITFKNMHGTLMAPTKRCKVIKLSEPERKSFGPGSEDIVVHRDRSKKDAIEPGNWGDLQLQLIQKTAALKLYCNGDQASINAGPLISKRAALFELIRDYGFREKRARQLIVESERSFGAPTVYRVKYAAGYPWLQPGPSSPEMPEPTYGSDPAGGGVQTQYPMEEYLPVPELDPSMTDPSVYDNSPDAMMDQRSMQTAQQAGQMGQKEVFDTSMLTGMLKAVRQESLVDVYTGDLMKALDRLGRLLFMFYWHNDDFKDRFGQSEMPELEDSLRNTFESLGDVLLYLRRKSIEPFGVSSGEPSVDEAAG